MSETQHDDHYRLLFPTDYIAAPELKGKDVTLTIKSVSLSELPLAGSTKKEKRAVMTFEGTPKKLVLNKTNAKVIAKLLGVHTSAWIGKRIVLYPTTTKFGPDTVDCIRIREKLPPPGRSEEAA